MGEDRSHCEGRFEVEEDRVTIRGEIPRGILSSELNEWDNDVGVIEDETMVEIGQSEMAFTLLEEMDKPLVDSWYPRYSTEKEWNSHFSSLA